MSRSACHGSFPQPRSWRSAWPATAGAIFAAAWLVAAWEPRFPRDWALENVLSLAAAWWLVRRHRRQPLSNLSYALLLLFGIAHELGSHYTYAEVPYREWIGALVADGPERMLAGRNHYDRFVHGLFGLLCYLPLREVLARYVAPGPPRWIAPLLLVAAISQTYEQIEMLAALSLGGDLGQAFLGTQGDEWDAQRDSLLAIGGAATAMALSALSAALRRARDAKADPRRV